MFFSSATIFVAILSLSSTTSLSQERQGSSLYLPGEDGPQDCIYIVFGASRAIYDGLIPGRNVVPAVRQSLARIANAAAAFQPVRILVRPNEQYIAERLIDPAVSSNVSFIPMRMNDIWARDILPIIVQDKSVSPGGNNKVAVGLNFNGWGRKQEHRLDAQVARKVASYLDIPFIRSTLVGEGGGIEVDGEGTAIMTESCWLNRNRNPGMSKAEIEAELNRVFGIEKVIWLPGIKGKDITDAHIDFYARFARPGVVFANLDMEKSVPDYKLTRRHLEILKTATDAKGRPLTIVTLATPTQVRPEFSGVKSFSPGYMNFLVLNGGVIIPEFGDAEADAAAKKSIEDNFPGRKVLQVNIDPIAAGGGGIHCTTMHQPTIQ